MNKRSVWLLVLFAALFMPGAVVARNRMRKARPDHPLFNRIRAFTSAAMRNREFDCHPFILGDGKQVSVEGHLVHINLREAGERGSLRLRPPEL